MTYYLISTAAILNPIQKQGGGFFTLTAVYQSMFFDGLEPVTE